MTLTAYYKQLICTALQECEVPGVTGYAPHSLGITPKDISLGRVKEMNIPDLYQGDSTRHVLPFSVITDPSKGETVKGCLILHNQKFLSVQWVYE